MIDEPSSCSHIALSRDHLLSRPSGLARRDVANRLRKRRRCSTKTRSCRESPRATTHTSTARAREHMSVADLAPCCDVRPTQLLAEAARAFDADVEASRDREIVKPPQLIAERNYLASARRPGG
jgi:hypothetical protein